MEPRKYIDSLPLYSPDCPDEILCRKLGVESLCRLHKNENPLGMSPKALAAVEKAARDNLFHDSYGERLRLALSDEFHLWPHNFVFGKDIWGLMELIIETYAESGSEVLVPITAYSRFAPLFAIHGLVGSGVPLNEYQKIDLPTVNLKVTEKTKIIYLQNPCDPTGTTYNSYNFRSFMNRVDGAALVVVDESYGDYVTDENCPKGVDYLKDYDNLIILRSFSYLYGMAGLNLGFAISNRTITSNLNRVAQFESISDFAQAAAIGALADKEYLARGRDEARLVRDFYCQELKKRRLEYIAGEGNFVLIKTKKPGREVALSLYKKGIFVCPGEEFGYPDCIRVSFGTRKENVLFFAALDELLQ